MDVLANFEVLFKARGLSAVHGRVFGTILLSDGKISQKEIAEQSGYSIPAVSIALDELVRLGLVEKEKHERTYFYSTDAKMSNIMKNFLLTIQRQYVEPFLRDCGSCPPTPGVKKLVQNMNDFDEYLSKLLEVKV